MTDETEDSELEGPLAVEFPDPIYLTSPDGVHYCITDEGALCEALGVEGVMAWRATDAGLEWLTVNRHWESVEQSGKAKVSAIRKN